MPRPPAHGPDGSPDLRRVCAIVTDPVTYHSMVSLQDIATSGFEIPLVLVGQPETGAAYRRAKRPLILQPFFNDWKMLWAASDAVLGRPWGGRAPGELGRSVGLDRLRSEVRGLASAEVHELRYEQSGRHTRTIASEQVATIGRLCDAVVLLGFNRILRGPILTATRFGVLSLHPADTFKYRGRPHGFFEWLNDEPELGITIQRLNEELDGGEVIVQRHVPLRHARSRQQALTDLWKASLPDLFSTALREVGRHGAGRGFPVPGPASQLHRQRDADRFGNAWRYAWRNVQRRFRRVR